MSGDNSHFVVDVKCQASDGVTCEHVFFLQQQTQYIEELRAQLSSVMAERDMLLCEVSRLKFELEIADLKRINDDRPDASRNESIGSNAMVNGVSGERVVNGSLNGEKEWYELSQDLIEKQIELLERKYGGDRARTAALTIQRAFRHYTLVKKFATITAMAKAEKRFSRRLVGFQEEGAADARISNDCQSTSANKPNANMPLRSLSMREKRTVQATPTLPRSYSGRCELACYSTTTPSKYYGLREMQAEQQKQDELSGKNSRSPRIPPEVPKRTSSISVRSLETPPGANLNKNSDSGSVSSVQSSGSDSSVMPAAATTKTPQVSETVRKRQYRVGLNLFNKKPERGISYLVKRGFLDNASQSIAHFLITRKGLSKQMIGEYLGNLQDPFNGATLEYFAQEMDLSGMQVDVALRKFQTYFRMPGEAQKVERIIEVFSHRYCQCNRDMVARLRNLDTVFVLAFAIIMLNTDLHTPNMKAERRMTLDEFVKNLRGVDDCCDIDKNMLIGIYDRVKANEFKTGSDHVTQVLKVQSTIVGKKPNLALPHRRLVCYCRLYEVHDANKKERPGVHQREVFLFNDLLVITKILSKKKSSVTYTFRQSFSLSGLAVALFEVPYYPYGIRLSRRVDYEVLITFNARNDHDRAKFVEDIRESISEMDEMENLRIEAEVEKQKNNRNGRSVNTNCNENRDSGVADVEVCPCIHSESPTHFNESHSSANLNRATMGNSLLDIHEQDQCSTTHYAEQQPVYSPSLDQSDSL
uniref:IQ motif and SEC7 domain-containing protein 1 n=4 Tax=Lygus hesperus TaxID=30085 RepID=A0A0A9W1S5_LYGHE